MTTEPLPLPKRLGRYRVVRALGEGGMASVFVARDELLHRDVAIKTLREAIPTNGLPGQMFRDRFAQEARAIGALAHPSIVRVFDMGFEGDTPFLVMELVEGRSLRERMDAEQRLPAADVRALGIQIARGLEVAHAAGIIHRDVKPANILEASGGVWKLADFGVAHVPDSSLTLAGQFVGTPSYAAPESLTSGLYGAASDVYALGATMYEALAGQPPHGAGKGLQTVIATATRGDPPALLTLRPDLPPDLATGVMRALTRDPHARPTAAALAQSLATPAAAAVRASFGIPHRKTIGLIAALVCAVVIGILIGSRKSSDSIAASPGDSIAASPAAAPVQRSAQQEERWRKVNEKLAEGKLDDAAEELEKILRDDPDDAEARDLLEQLRSF